MNGEDDQIRPHAIKMSQPDDDPHMTPHDSEEPIDDEFGRVGKSQEVDQDQRPPLDTVGEQELEMIEGLPLPPTQDTSPKSNAVANQTTQRPVLLRERSVPQRIPPPTAPPPAPPIIAQRETQASSNAPLRSINDVDKQEPSLEPVVLQQLKHLIPETPVAEPSPYAFVYEDTASLQEELEEWFSYSQEEQGYILKTHTSFAQEWASSNGWVFLELDSGNDNWSPDWSTIEKGERKSFAQRLLRLLKEEQNLDKRMRALEALTYLCLGAWRETAGRRTTEESETPGSQEDGSDLEQSLLQVRSAWLGETYQDSTLQLRWLKSNIALVFECHGLQTIYDIARDVCLRECEANADKAIRTTQQREAETREAWCATTLFYLCLEVARSCEDEGQKTSMRSTILNLNPSPLVFWSEIVAKLRWDESIKLPMVKVLLILWKAILLSFGGAKDITAAKGLFKVDLSSDNDIKGPLISASPLDYHTFRQEISSKYPAYVPPPPLFPFEPESKSMLPPLRNGISKSVNDNIAEQATFHSTSMLEQPVHIATPAPSPPPSPAVGKGGKKQNYQTNQLFPFLYPPLDANSNHLGGKGSTDLQDALVGRRWTGSDIPASISEAAELFSKRMRATRPMKQLWEERINFMKFERGWTGKEEEHKSDTLDDDSDDEDVNVLELEGKLAELGLRVDDEEDDTQREVDGPLDGHEQPSTDSPEGRLQLVEQFYHEGLPYFQSMVMILMKTILTNVTALMTASTGPNGLVNSFNFADGGQNGTTTKDMERDLNGWNYELSHMPVEELDAIRTQEIIAKAASGVLITLLKWFKVSHILKFEYLSQLLVDANYIPMILKLLQTQELEKQVNFRNNREDLNFFAFCRAHSLQPIDSTQADIDETSADPRVTSSSSDMAHDLSDSSDDAMPPPIKRHRELPMITKQDSPPDELPLPTPVLPEVDELGFPISTMPTTPITSYSHRNFLSSINYLRVLQKLCKGKAHRNLMLVTYKSAPLLKKSLKIPQKELRLYTLKLFKNQVPYCGRKWRQSNMRVITAVYLHCRPELRDEWLCSGDVDGEVEMSVPNEQALRSLTHWHNLRLYPEKLGAERSSLREEQDFFLRELERIDWGRRGFDGEEGDGDWRDGINGVGGGGRSEV